MTICHFLKTKFNMSLMDQIAQWKCPRVCLFLFFFLVWYLFTFTPQKTFSIQCQKAEICNYMSFEMKREWRVRGLLKIGNQYRAVGKLLKQKSKTFSGLQVLVNHFFFTNWSILLIRHRQNQECNEIFAQLCKNKKRKTKKRCLTVCI